MSLLHDTTLTSTHLPHRYSTMPSSSSQHMTNNTPFAQNAADTLPAINFNFEDLRDRMAKFTHRFDTFIAEGRKRVLDERNEYKTKIAELAEDKKMKDRSIEILQCKTAAHASTLAKETAEESELLASISSLSLARTSREETRNSLRLEIAAITKTIAQKTEAQKAHAAKMSDLARFNIPELDFWTDYLCLRIEGVGKADFLRFVFSHVDPSDWERECWFEVALGEREYDVVRTEPRLEDGVVRGVVGRVNEDRDFKGFVRGMRDAFVEAIR